MRQNVAVDEERRLVTADKDGGDDGEGLELSPGVLVSLAVKRRRGVERSPPCWNDAFSRIAAVLVRLALPLPLAAFPSAGSDSP